MTSNDLKTIWKRDDEAQRRADLAEIIATAAGRRFLMHLITITGVYRTSDSPDPSQLAYAAGQRDTGLAILALANHANAHAVFSAMQERNTLMASRNAQLSNLQPKD